MKVAYGANGKDGSDGLIGRELSKLLPRSRKQKLWKSQPFQYRHHIYYDVDMPSEPIKLKIVLNGEAPGIAEHRLSIGGLALPLAHLLKATRRIASDIVRDGGQYASRRGPYAREARAIDLQIETLGQGCVEVNLVASIDEAQGFQTGLFPQDMLLRTMSNLLDAIKAESTGEERNRTVRAFLQMLPSGIQSQKYNLYQNGTLVKKLDISKVSLPQISSSLPFLDLATATITGVSFPPGPSEVWLRTEHGAVLRCSAKTDLVDFALSHRAISLEALLLRRVEKPRLLWLKRKEDWKPASHEQKMDHILDLWTAVLGRLAQ